jgi:hypothetical protein
VEAALLLASWRHRLRSVFLHSPLPGANEEKTVLFRTTTQGKAAAQPYLGLSYFATTWLLKWMKTFFLQAYGDRALRR